MIIGDLGLSGSGILSTRGAMTIAMGWGSIPCLLEGPRSFMVEPGSPRRLRKCLKVPLPSLRAKRSNLVLRGRLLRGIAPRDDILNSLFRFPPRHQA